MVSADSVVAACSVDSTVSVTGPATGPAADVSAVVVVVVVVELASCAPKSTTSSSPACWACSCSDIVSSAVAMLAPANPNSARHATEPYATIIRRIGARRWRTRCNHAGT